MKTDAMIAAITLVPLSTSAPCNIMFTEKATGAATAMVTNALDIMDVLNFDEQTGQ